MGSAHFNEGYERLVFETPFKIARPPWRSASRMVNLSGCRDYLR
jgi:hypothetical protein